MTDRPIRQALLSVSDKTGIVELLKASTAWCKTTFHRRYRKIIGTTWFTSDRSV